MKESVLSFEEKATQPWFTYIQEFDREGCTYYITTFYNIHFPEKHILRNKHTYIILNASYS